MDEYDKKFAEMQKYIPFLEAMIERLQNVKDKSREIQLQKMQSLHGILSNSKRKLKIETLQRCEDVLQKLHSRVEKGNTPGLQLATKQNDAITLQSSTLLDDAKMDRNDKEEQTQNAKKASEIEETPASPDPGGSSSPDCQILPIIIPTERSTDLQEKCNRSQPIKSKIIPVITLTDHSRNISSPIGSNTDDIMFSEWDMLEESEKHNVKNKDNWQSITSDNDVTIAAKLVSSNLPQKINDGNRSYALGSRSSVPVSSRFTSVLEKNKLNLDISGGNSSRSESPVNVPEVRLNSPDPEILFAKPRITSPRSKDNPNVHMKSISKSPSIPLLLSPPASSKPSLSMEDLAKLLNDESDAEKKGDKTGENIMKCKKDLGKQEMNLINKDSKATKNFLFDAVRENEKRWEETNNHNVKFTAKKSIPNIETTSVIKSNEIKKPSYQSNDHRSTSQVSSLGSKFQEPRYADNYEKHPRQRDVHSQQNKQIIPNAAAETSPQIQQQNVVNKSDERNVSLYQRRPNVLPEGWKETVLPRMENEFLIEGIDYYNLHTNQMHWPSSVTIADNQFNNTQWTSPVYSGISNSSLQLSTQLSYQHPMEPQFRSSQFSPNLSAGPRPLISSAVRSQDMNHAARSENIREDIPPLRSASGFSVAPQYRGFQGSYDPAFDRPSTEYSHVRSIWSESANRVNEVPYENIISCGIQAAEGSTISYPRSNTSWGSRDRDRCNRGRGRDGYYSERNRTEIRSNFNRDIRRPDWPRDNHSDRENPLNRFINRDPRLRTQDHNATNLNQTKEISVRDPRLAKDKHVNTPVKAKDTAQNERDPRKRLVPSFNSTTKTTMPTKENSKLQKSEKEPEKEKMEKLGKDRMQSPLESLYGAIDTKSCQSSGLQKFRIPKIKRCEPLQPSYIVNESKGSATTSKSPREKSDVKNSKKNNCNSTFENTGKEDTNAEVSSSSDTSYVTENLIQLKQSDISSFAKDKNEIKIGEADSVTNDSKSNDIATDKDKKDELEADGTKSKDEVTQEWIEALIRKSFESGEGKKLVEQAKLIHKLGEALKAKKFEKIKKIIDSESESNSDKEAIESRKTQTKKKRRVIVSDSSDDECLAERLGILSTSINASNERTELIPVIATDTKSLKEKIETTIPPNNLNEELAKDATGKINDESLENNNEKCNVQTDDNNKNIDVRFEKEIEMKNDQLKSNNEKIDIQLKSDKQINDSLCVTDEDEHREDEHNNKQKTQVKDVHKVDLTLENKSNNTNNTEQSLDLNKNLSDCTEPIVPNNSNNRADEISDSKPKIKTKRRNSLEMLQEDIREMFISEGVVTATGYRMCRMSKEGLTSGNASLSGFKKDVMSNALDKKITESNSEADESTVNNPKFKKVLRSNKAKTKNKKDVKQVASRNLRSKESIPNSDSEEDQPLALRTEKLLNNTGNSLPCQEENYDEESLDILRKSKRIIHKDSIKESRVIVEKTDIAKLHSSKVMFDSSSDESFGIDVSELAAAVNISPQPDCFLNQEKQSDQDSTDTAASLKRQKITKSSKCNVKQKKSSFIADNKNEDRMSLTDEESIMSDISMSNNTIVKKRMSDDLATTSTREELLSNILVGLVPTEKSLTDKGSEADFDDDTNDLATIETNARKCSVKKKKKKSSWQMGIVSTKKKKRKTVSITSFKTIQTNVEETNEMTIPMNVVEDDRTVLEDNNVAMTEKTLTKSSIDNLTNVNPLDSKTSCDNVKSLSTNNSDVALNNTKSNNLAASESTSVDRESKNEESLFLKENKPIIKREKETEQIESMKSTVTASNIDTMITSCRKSSKIIYDEIMEELFRETSIDQLINYAWTGQDRYKCFLCIFVGKNIIHHYKMNHPEREVLIARFKLVDAETAIADTKSKMRSVESMITDEVCKFRCRFCCFVTEGAVDVAIEAFYEHCTTHTGEYRFHCNTCTYQAVAKASMRTHYYKMCRKHNDTFSESVSEDDVPKEGGVYGYLCRECNYVQLKRSNVEVHVTFWHRDTKNTEIVKINMSATNVVEVVSCDQASQESMPNVEKSFVETKLEFSEPDNADGRDMSEINIVKTRKSQENNSNISRKFNTSKSKTEEKITIKEEETDEKSKVSQGETENLVNTSNLSVFVCPPELENKEVEIQRERQKMMQEVANNIGILLKNFSKPGLSIIDKLQNKMRTDAIVNSIPECNTVQCNATNALETMNPSLSACSTAESLESVNNMIIKDSLHQSSQEDRPSLKKEQLVVDKSTVANVADSKTDTKIWDPLAIMDRKKDDESDGEISDNERSAPIFESDSSEQSDSESTDVNMILKETSNMNVLSSRDPMLTTIQRLAAQLQSTKSSLEPMLEMSENKMEIKCESAPLIPKFSDVVSIVNVTHSSRQNTEKTETPEQVSTTCNDSSINPPKNFIRFRRLSGDILSMPVQLLNDQKNIQTASADATRSNSVIDMLQTDTEEECSFLKIENVVSLAPRSDSNETESSIINNIRKAVEISSTKNKVSPLKRSNQPLILKKVNIMSQSLASANAQGHISTCDIQPVTSEHVTLLPIKSLPASVPTKSTTTHLKNMNFVPIASKIIPLDSSKVSFQSSNKTPVTSSITTPLAISSNAIMTNASSNLNYKILKVVRTPALIKPKDPSISSIMISLKSADAYTMMLKERKLVHFYKCMSRDCHYTTDSLTLYGQHYHQHHEEVSKQNNRPPYDFQKCAYCYVSLSDWTNIKIHLWEKHSHCQYQCAYCFYRALVPSYVQQHQALYHPGSKFHFLMGKMIKPVQKQEDINRNDYIMPFVCNHDCGKLFYVFDTFIMHLKTKQIPPQSTKHVYKCHLCTTTHGTIELLMLHYKLHGFSKYQCLYCLYGAETLSEMHQHLSSFHYNRLPQALERALPSPPTRHTDIVQQLILQTFDNSQQLSTNVNERIDNLNDDSSKKNISIEKEVDDDPSNTEIAANTSAKQSKDSSHATIIKTISNNTPEKQLLSEKLVLKLDENESLEKKKLNESDATNQIHKSELELLSCINDINAIDPIKCSNEFNSSDEFVNTNFLDNSKILKKFVVNSGNMAFFKDNTAVSESKTEDSDIEILENIENEKKIVEKKNIENNTNQTIDSESSKKNVEKKEQFTCDTTENKCIPENAPIDSNVNTQQEKLLTLDDIKDTGRTGLELYKCGYPDCNFAAHNVSLLRAHIKECNFEISNKNLFCPHCKKRFVKVGFLLEHLKTHGLKRFGCSQCKMRYAVSYQATAHMKTKHKFSNTKLVPADPTNPSVDGLFVVHAIPFEAAERKTKKRKGARSGTEQEKEKVADNEKLSFNLDEIEQLPRQAIYNREVQCAVCPYTTKVRTNIIRHLQLHAKDETVPEIGPVNPVPCLDKKEKMFDKMVNLASSSHQNGRMGGKPKEPVKENEQDNGIPKFVPEHKRYVCSVAECNYLTVDEAMLRYHLKALHSEEPYFRCPHCPPSIPGQENQNIMIDKMGIHLKMHDTRLYKCSHCNHHHYQRHVVERHLTDKHPEKRPFVKVIRELESTENIQQSVQEEAEEEIPDPDGNHWKCNLCDFKCVYKADITIHAATIHDENSQYKCTLCSFKTSGKIILEQHISSKHVSDPNLDYITVYQRIKGINKRNVETTEQGGQEEPFDTTPLWRRSMPRIRHIRGILLEEEIETSAMNEVSPITSKMSLGKRKSDVDISTKPVKIKSTGKSLSFDENNKQLKEKPKKSLLCEKLCEVEGEGHVTKKNIQNKVDLHTNDKSTKNLKVDTIDLNDVNDSDVGRFGSYGKPAGNLYICTLCNHFRTKYKHDMRDHLYRELNYARWHCKACGYLSVNRNALLQHFGKRHNGECPEHEPLSPDNAIEDWVMTLLKKQTDMIKVFQHSNATCKNITIPVNTSIISPEINKTVSAKTIQVNKKTVNLASTTISLQNNLRYTNKSTDIDDGDSRDEELVIDIKEDEKLENKNNENERENDNYRKRATEILEKPLVCKHCRMKFTRLRGFKLHVQLSHLKRLFLLCPYCDRSTNSEAIMRQHIRSKHPNDPEKIIRNPSAWGSAKLTNEFWEKEYGLVFPLKTKKRKLNANDNSSDDKGSDDNSNSGSGSGNGSRSGGNGGGNGGSGGGSGNDGGSSSNGNDNNNSNGNNTSNGNGSSNNSSSNSNRNRSKDTTSDATAGNRTDVREKCEICGFVAMNYIGLKSHMRMHATPKHNLKCSYCTYTCCLKAELLEHWEFNHSSLPLKYHELSAIEVFEAENKPLLLKERDIDVYDALNVEEEYMTFNSNSTLTAIYSCFYCNFCHKSLSCIRRHWAINHKKSKISESTLNVKTNLPFRYKQMHLPISKLSSSNFVNKTIIESSRNFAKQSSTMIQQRGWICQWCKEFCDTDNDRITHQNMFHSHLPQNFKKQEQQEQQEDQFENMSTQVVTHNIEKHLNLTTRIENVSNFDSVVENLMNRAKRNETSNPRNEINESHISILKGDDSSGQAVARKSTAKSVLLYSRPGPRVFKAVARKSTNPLPKYRSSIFTSRLATSQLMKMESEKEETNNSKSSYSHYGISKNPINLSELSTYMVVGGHSMRVNCLTLATLININPKVMLTDIKKVRKT